MPIREDVKRAGLNALKTNCDPEEFHTFCEAYGIDSATEEKIWFDVQLLGHMEPGSKSEGDEGLEKIQEESEKIHKYLTSLIIDAAERELHEVDFPIAEFVGNIMHIIDEVIRKISDKFKVPSAVLFTFMWINMAPVVIPMIKIAAQQAANCLPPAAKSSFHKLSVASRQYLNTIAVKTMGEKTGQMDTLNKLLTQMVAFKMTGMPVKVLADQLSDLPESKITTGDGGSAMLCGLCLMYGVGAFMGSDFVNNFVAALPSGATLVPGLFALQFVAGEAHTLAEGFSVTVIPSQLFVGYKTCAAIQEGLESKVKDLAVTAAEVLELNALLGMGGVRTKIEESRIKVLLRKLDISNEEQAKKELEKLLPDPNNGEFKNDKKAFTNYYLYKLIENPFVDAKVKEDAKSTLTKGGCQLDDEGIKQITEAFNKRFNGKEEEKERLMQAVDEQIKTQYVKQQGIIENTLSKRNEETIKDYKEEYYNTHVDPGTLDKIKAGYMPGKAILGKPKYLYQRLTYPIVNNFAYPILRTVRDGVILPALDIICIGIALPVGIYNRMTPKTINLPLSFKQIAGLGYQLTKYFDKGRLKRTSDEWKALRDIWIKEREALDKPNELNNKNRALTKNEKENLDKRIKDVDKKIIVIERFIYKIKKEQDKLEDKNNNLSKLAQFLTNPFRSTGPKGNTVGAHLGGYGRSILNLGGSLFEAKDKEGRIEVEIEKELGNSPEERLITFMNKYQNMTLNKQNALRKDYGLTPAQIYSQVYDYMGKNNLLVNKTLERDAHKFLLQERKESIDLMFLSPVLFFVRPLVLIPAFMATVIGKPNIARYDLNMMKEGYQADVQGLIRILGTCTIPLVTVLSYVYDTFLSRIFRTMGRRLTGGRPKLDLKGLEVKEETLKEETSKEETLMGKFKISNEAYEAQANAVKQGLVEQILINTEPVENPLKAKESKNEAQKNLIGLYANVVRTCSIFENLIDTKVDKDNIKDILDKLDFAITTIEGALDEVAMDDSMAVLQEFKVLRNKILGEEDPKKVEELLGSTVIGLNGFCLKDVLQSFLSKFTFETSLFNQKTEKSYAKAFVAFFVNIDDFSKKLVDCTSNINRYKSKILNTYSKVIDSTKLPKEAKYVTEKKAEKDEEGALIVKKRQRFTLSLRKLFISMDFVNAMGDARKISSRINREEQRERDDNIAKIHKVLKKHKDSISTESEENNQKSKEAIENFNKLHSTFNELERTESGQTVHTDRVKAIHQTVKNIHQKISSNGEAESNMDEVHTVIERAGKIAEIHEFLEEHKGKKDGASKTIDNFTTLHQALNEQEKNPQCGNKKLQEMQQKIDEFHDKITKVRQEKTTDNDIKIVHNHIHEQLVAGQ